MSCETDRAAQGGAGPGPCLQLAILVQHAADAGLRAALLGGGAAHGLGPSHDARSVRRLLLNLRRRMQQVGRGGYGDKYLRRLARKRFGRGHVKAGTCLQVYACDDER